MIIKLLQGLFNMVIGKLPEDKKKELLGKFSDLLKEVVTAAAAGAVQGAMKQ